MSALYATLQSEKTGKVTRTANNIIAASLQSYDGSVSVSMNKFGNIFISVDNGSTDNPSQLVLSTTIQELLEVAREGAYVTHIGDMVRI